METKNEPKKRNQYEFDKKAYDHIHLQVYSGKRNVIRDAATQRGESLNGYIKRAVAAQLLSETGETVVL